MPNVEPSERRSDAPSLACFTWPEPSNSGCRAASVTTAKMVAAGAWITRSTLTTVPSALVSVTVTSLSSAVLVRGSRLSCSPWDVGGAPLLWNPWEDRATGQDLDGVGHQIPQLHPLQGGRV